MNPSGRWAQTIMCSANTFRKKKEQEPWWDDRDQIWPMAAQDQGWAHSPIHTIHTSVFYHSHIASPTFGSFALGRCFWYESNVGVSSQSTCGTMFCGHSWGNKGRSFKWMWLGECGWGLKVMCMLVRAWCALQVARRLKPGNEQQSEVWQNLLFPQCILPLSSSLPSSSSCCWLASS